MKKNKLYKKGFITISILLLLLFITNISIKFGITNLFHRNIVEAVNIIDTLGIIKDNNPINILLNKEIVTFEEEKARILLEKEREIAAVRLEIERQIALGQARIDKKLENERKKDGKIVYLTFDDGPSLVVTPRILDILDEYDIKATFFVIGREAEKHPEILQRIHQKGHNIGNHSYSHNYSYIYKNSRNLLSDIERADQVFKRILGKDFYTNIVRFPGGSFGKNNKIIQAVVDAGYQYYDWNSLNGDAEGIRFSTDRLIKRFKETSRNKRKLIVLMHDTDAKDTTADSLRYIIDYLIDQGYEFDVLENYVE